MSYDQWILRQRDEGRHPALAICHHSARLGGYIPWLRVRQNDSALYVLGSFPERVEDFKVIYVGLAGLCPANYRLTTVVPEHAYRDVIAVIALSSPEGMILLHLITDPDDNPFEEVPAELIPYEDIQAYHAIDQASRRRLVIVPHTAATPAA